MDERVVIFAGELLTALAQRDDLTQVMVAVNQAEGVVTAFASRNPCGRAVMDTVDFSFITSNNAATSNLILTTDSDRTMLILCNYTDVELGFAYDYSQGWDLAPGKEMVLDLGSNFLKMVTDKDISVFYTNTPPTTGTASVTII